MTMYSTTVMYGAPPAPRDTFDQPVRYAPVPERDGTSDSVHYNIAMVYGSPPAPHRAEQRVPESGTPAPRYEMVLRALRKQLECGRRAEELLITALMESGKTREQAVALFEAALKEKM